MLARFAYGATALAALVLIFGGRFVPLQDYADWVFQADLFARLLRGELPSEVAFVGALAPNALCTLVMGMLALVMPVELAGKLFLIGSVLSFLWAGDRLSRARAGGGPLAFITPIFALNYSFFHGNINYAFGLALLLASAAYLIRREDAAKPGALALFSIALYFAHGAVLVAWAVLLAAFALSRASSGRARTAALGFAPVLPLGIAYVALQGSGGSAITYADAGGFHWLSFLDLKASTFTRMLALFHGFHPLYAGIAALVLPLAVGNFVFLALLVYALRTAPGRVVRERLWFGYAAAALFLLCLLAPRESGGLVNPGERLVLPGVFLLSLCVQPEKRPQPLRNALFAALLGSLAFLLFHGRQAQAALSRFHAALERASCGQSLGVVPESHFDYGARRPARSLPAGWLLLPRHHPLLRQALYIELERHRPATIFSTGMFHYRGAATTFSSWSALEANLPAVLAIVGAPDGRQLLTSQLSSRYREIETGHGFSMLQARNSVRGDCSHGKMAR